MYIPPNWSTEGFRSILEELNLPKAYICASRIKSISIKVTDELEAKLKNSTFKDIKRANTFHGIPSIVLENPTKSLQLKLLKSLRSKDGKINDFEITEVKLEYAIKVENDSPGSTKEFKKFLERIISRGFQMATGYRGMKSLVRYCAILIKPIVIDSGYVMYNGKKCILVAVSVYEVPLRDLKITIHSLPLSPKDFDFYDFLPEAPPGLVRDRI